MTRVSLGANSKLVVLASERESIQHFYRDVLECKVDINPQADLIWLRPDFYLGVVYENSALRASDMLKSLWLELRTDHPEELKQKILKFGLKEIEYQDKEHFYFQAPGGQVFRLANTTEDLNLYRPHLESAIVLERTIAAAPRSVYNALTKPDEIVHWWAYEARVKPEVGSLGEFRFRPPAGVLQFEVAELDQDEKVHWISRQGPPQWTGTSVTWQLTPVQNGTTLVFTHDGFAQVDDTYEQTRGNWDYFLDSLKSYLETGKGTPGHPLSAK
jgi:uncharacterized protein YndB with AHSA1/START domain